MNIKTNFHQNNYWFGILLSILIPIPVFFIFYFVIKLVQNQLHVFELVKTTDIILLGLAANLIVMRYYLVKLRLEKTGKAILVLTVIMILFFFLFQKNSNFALPF